MTPLRAFPTVFALAALLLSSPAGATASASFAGGQLSISGSGADAVTVSCVAANVKVNGGDPNGGPAACNAVVLITVTISGPSDGNLIDLEATEAGGFTGLALTTIATGPGDDTILGSAVGDTIDAGTGHDFVVAGRGGDSVTLGDGDDAFRWDPGDGNDAVEGGPGVDRVRFVGALAAESYEVSAVGPRVRLTRDVGAVALSFDDVERLELDALGGADTITQRALAGTDLAQASYRLAGALDGSDGDAASDRLVLHASASPDVLQPQLSGAMVTMIAGATAVEAQAFETGDVLALDAGAQDDAVLLDASLDFVVDVAGGDGTDTLRWSGSDGDDVVAMAPAPRLALAGAARIGALGDVEQVRVSLGAGADHFDASALASSQPVGVDGDGGADVLIGGSGDDLLAGGAGADTLDGRPGVDVLVGGDDGDLVRWRPGDGSDVIDGDAGDDRLEFTAAVADEQIALARSGARLALTRDIGSVLLDVGGVERVAIEAGGGADSLRFDDLGGSGLRELVIDPASAATSDGAADVLRWQGGDGNQTLVLAAAAADVTLADGALLARILAPDPAQDRLDVEGGGGDDLLALDVAALAALPTTYDGGSDGAGIGDTLSFGGSDVEESYAIVAQADGFGVQRSAPDAHVLVAQRSEHLLLDLRDGADVLDTVGLPATRQQLAGGSPLVAPGDTLNVGGFDGDVLAPTILVPGAQPIGASGWERSALNLVRIEAFLAAEQVVPRSASTARGSASLELDETQEQATLMLSFGGLAGDSSAVHVHGPAVRGENAAVILDGLPVSNLPEGAFTAGPFVLSVEQLRDLKAGRWYIDVHSSAATDGEIRGQFDNRLFVDGFE